MFFRLSATGASRSTACLAGRADDDFLHVAVGRVEQAALFGGGQHGDGAGRAGGAQVGAFEGIDGDVDFGDLAAVGKFGADFLADVEHGRFIALAFADDDGAAHGDGVHGLAHGFGGDLVGERTVALSHGARRGDGGFFDDAQELERQIAFQIDAEAFDLRFGPGIGSHEVPPEDETGLRLYRLEGEEGKDRDQRLDRAVWGGHSCPPDLKRSTGVSDPHAPISFC